MFKDSLQMINLTFQKVVCAFFFSRKTGIKLQIGKFEIIR